MTTRTALLLAALGAARVQAAVTTHPELPLSTGNILRQARIVSIAGDTITIVHSGGAIGVPADRIALDILARARMELDAIEAARAARAEEARKKAAELAAAEEQEKAAERRRVNTPPPVNPAPPAPAAPPAALPAAIQKPTIGHQIVALKAAFPPREKGSARVFIPRSGRNERPYVISSSVSQLPDGSRYSTESIARSTNGRIDVIQYDAPAEESWNWYRGMFQTTTAAAYPRTLQLVEARLAEDIAKLQLATGGLSASGQAQAQHTLHWIDKTLRPYIARWRELGR